jgi:hypothetical protein
MFSACAGMIVLPPGCSGSQRVTSRIIPAWQTSPFCSMIDSLPAVDGAILGVQGCASAQAKLRMLAPLRMSQQLPAALAACTSSKLYSRRRSRLCPSFASHTSCEHGLRHHVRAADIEHDVKYSVCAAVRQCSDHDSYCTWHPHRTVTTSSARRPSVRLAASRSCAMCSAKLGSGPPSACASRKISTLRDIGCSIQLPAAALSETAYPITESDTDMHAHCILRRTGGSPVEGEGVDVHLY